MFHKQRRNGAWIITHDLILAFFSPIMAILLREQGSVDPEKLVGTQIYVLVSFLAALLVFPLFGLHRRIWRYTSLNDVYSVALAVGGSVILTTFITFTISRHDDVSRSVPFLHFLFMVVTLLISRAMVQTWRKRKHISTMVLANGNESQSIMPRPEHALILGVSLSTTVFMRILKDLPHIPTKILGLLDGDQNLHGGRIDSHPVLGSIADLPRVLGELEVHGLVVDRILIGIPYDDIPLAARAVLEDLKEQGKIRIDRLDLLLDSVHQLTEQRPQDITKSIETKKEPSGTMVAPPKATGFYNHLKPVLDILAGGTMMALALPVMMLVAVVVLFSAGRPILFWQVRPGYRGKMIKVYKFRTMKPGLDRHNRLLSDDERQTPILRLLRRSRLDELPQLYNIMIGEMSLVGPRPLLPRDQSSAMAAKRLQMRPGVTGWAQVNGGTLVDQDEKLALDMWYSRNASLGLDLKIIWMSLKMVLYGDKRNQNAINEALISKPG